MIILVNGYGNHTNRLIQNAHIEAFCIDNNIPYFNAAFFCMVQNYPLAYNYSKALYYTFLFKSGIIEKYYPYIEFNDENNLDEYKKILLNYRDKHIFVGGWHFRDYVTLQKHRSILRQKYETHKTSHRFEELVKLTSCYDIVLGLHIRLGDYKKWNNGIYYYSFDTYKQFVYKFVSLYPQKNILTLIFSNKHLTSKDISLPVDYRFTRLPYYLDHKLMSRCHYLIGPPSTFTIWPSFLYQVPYLHCYTAYQEFTLTDFQCSRG